MRYHVITYGCQMNKADSERISADLEKKGYKLASNVNEADLIVVNMCSVRQSAVDRVYGKTRNFAKLRMRNKELKIVLTGCILKTDKNKLREKFDEIWEVKEDKSSSSPTKLSPRESESGKEASLFDFAAARESNSIAYIPISNGCNNFCTYCVVPYTRGLLKCIDHKKILKEAKIFAKKKFREIWLLGQNVNDYKSRIISESKNESKRICYSRKLALNSHKLAKNKEVNFAKLLKMVNDIPGNFKIFFMSPNPKNFSDELIKVLANCEKFSRYLNLPFQSGNNRQNAKIQFIKRPNHQSIRN